MKIYISADMEGTAGVSSWDQVDARNHTADYFIYQKVMTAEVCAAIAGARKGGARDFLINDSHGPMRNLLLDELPQDARIIFGNRKPYSMVESLDRSFDGVFCPGYHGAIGERNATLCHTYTPSVVYDVRLNGMRCSEATLNAAIAGYYGGLVDSLLMRIVDVFLSVPTLFLLLFLAAMFHGSLATLMLVIGFTSWLGPARLVRGEVLTLKERLFVEAAKSLGAADGRIIFKHIVPNAAGTIITTTTFMVASAMLAETALSYLGIGVRAPTPSWGNPLSSAQSDIFAGAFWLILPPGLAILTTVCAFNFVGDWLRDVQSRAENGA